MFPALLSRVFCFHFSHGFHFSRFLSIFWTNKEALVACYLLMFYKKKKRGPIIWNKKKVPGSSDVMRLISSLCHQGCGLKYDGCCSVRGQTTNVELFKIPWNSLHEKSTQWKPNINFAQCAHSNTLLCHRLTPQTEEAHQATEIRYTPSSYSVSNSFQLTVSGILFFFFILRSIVE